MSDKIKVIENELPEGIIKRLNSLPEHIKNRFLKSDFNQNTEQAHAETCQPDENDISNRLRH